MSMKIFERLKNLDGIALFMRKLKTVPKEMVNEWLDILQELNRKHLSKNKGFEDSSRQTYIIIGHKYNVHSD